MPFLGCHLSVSGGFEKMGRNALSIGADTFQYFTRNPRGGAVKAADPADVAELRKIMKENRFGPLVAHGPYTLNPCSADAKVRDFAFMAMADDLKRLDESLPGCLYNFHPGSHVGQGTERGIELIVETLDEILPGVTRTQVLLEAMSGKGSEVGCTFEQLAEIISRTNCPEKMGVCLDTCHVYSAGYDIVGDLDGVLERFDDVIGLKRLRALHLNDSMTPFGSHKDRHEKLGAGSLGWEAFRRIVTHPALKDLPMCLETPQETLAGWGEEIARLRSFLAEKP
ncbi:MAG: deoxyribonuclease IV [Pyramidobacter sp.]